MTRIVLIGCGAVSRLYHGPALTELERLGEARVVGLIDPDEAARQRLASRFGGAAQLASADDLQRLQADVAVVASPPRFHAEHTLRALELGLSVLCEKPFAPSADDARAMAAAVQKAPGVLAAGFVRRFLPSARAVATLLRAGAVGEVVSFYAFEGGRFRWPVASAAYFNPSSGVGVLQDLGSHAADLMRWWFGELHCTTYEDDAAGGLDVNARISVRLYNGAVGTVRLSRDWDRPNEYVVTGTRGWIRWNVHEAGALEVGFIDGCGLKGHVFSGDVEGIDIGARPRRSRRAVVSRSSGRTGSTFEQAFIAQIRNVAAAHHGTETLVVPAREGVANAEFLASCCARRCSMEMGWLDEFDPISASTGAEA